MFASYFSTRSTIHGFLLHLLFIAIQEHYRVIVFILSSVFVSSTSRFSTDELGNFFFVLCSTSLNVGLWVSFFSFFLCVAAFPLFHSTPPLFCCFLLFYCSVFFCFSFVFLLFSSPWFPSTFFSSSFDIFCWPFLFFKLFMWLLFRGLNDLFAFFFQYFIFPFSFLPYS